MQSSLGSATLPAAGATDVGPFYTAGNGPPVRVYLRNNGATDIVLSLDSSALNGTAGLGGNSNQFILPADRWVEFYLQPRQSIFGIGAGGQASISWFASDATLRVG